MRSFSIILFLFFTIVGCGQYKTGTQQAGADYFSHNEDKFGFLVFDKAKVDSFFAQYSPLEIKNQKLMSSFRNLMLSKPSPETNEIRFRKHTSAPDSEDLDLARNVLTATMEAGDESYFGASLHYLFFYDCLPGEFQNKWTQSSLGDFEFDAAFFNRLRTRCKIFDEHIYGDSGYWDKNIQVVFNEEVYNEITADKAKLIRDCIDQDKAFNDKRLQQDKDDFIYFLNQAVDEKWRLFLIDKN